MTIQLLLLGLFLVALHFPSFNGFASITSSNDFNAAFYCWKLAKLLDANEGSLRVNVAVLVDDTLGMSPFKLHVVFLSFLHVY